MGGGLIMKMNCWEYQKCGREPGGANVRKSESCPSATETRLHGVHGGMNAGRACWVVGGTFCPDKVTGSFALQYETCSGCDFYQYVKNAEGDHFLPSAALLKKLNGV